MTIHCVEAQDSAFLCTLPKDNKICITVLQAGIQKCELLYQTIKICLYTTSDFINVYRNSRVVMGFEGFPWYFL